MAEKREQDKTEVQATIEQMYARTEHWISDFAYFKDELRFLISLTGQNFTRLLNNNISRAGLVREVYEQLIEVDNDREAISRDNLDNRSYLAGLIRNGAIVDREEFNEMQRELEDAQAQFLKKYVDIRDRVLQLSADINLKIDPDGRGTHLRISR